MALQDYFGGFPTAYNPDTGELVTDAVFQVYAVDDIGYTTPLAVTDPASGVPIATLRSTSEGVLRDFRVVGDPAQVILKSQSAPSFVTRLTSMYGALRAVGFDPEKIDAAIAAQPAAETARDAAVAAKVAAEAVPTSNDGIVKALIEDEDSDTGEALRSTIVSAGNVPTDYTWDATTGFIATITEHYPSPIGDRVTTYSAYGAYGPTHEVDPDGGEWTLTYDGEGNPTGREEA